MLRNRCVRCDYVIEATDDKLGNEVVCPECEATNVLRSEAEFRRQEAIRLARERERFLHALSTSRARPVSARLPRTTEAGWSPGTEDYSGHGLAILATRRLKDISVYLLVAAYLFPALALAPAVLVVFAGQPGIWSAIAFLLGSLVGVFAFIFFKFMSDTVRALADVTDLARTIDGRLAVLTEPIVIYDDVSESTDSDPVLSGQSTG